MKLKLNFKLNLKHIAILFIIILIIIGLIVLVKHQSNQQESYTDIPNGGPLIIPQANPFGSQFYNTLQTPNLQTSAPWTFTNNKLSAENNGIEFKNKAPGSDQRSSKWGHGLNGDWLIDSVNKAGKVILQDNTGGNVGIGTSNPQQKLSITGGDLGIWGGKIQFLDGNGSDETDPYSLQKICADSAGNPTPDTCSLRLTLNDNRNESLQIFGNSCALGNCGGPGALQHKFQADGSAYHSNNVQANGVTMGTDQGQNRGNGYVEIYPGHGGNASYIDFHNQPYVQGQPPNSMDGIDFSSRIVNTGSASQGQGTMTVFSNEFDIQRHVDPTTGTLGIGYANLSNNGNGHLFVNGVNKIQLPDNAKICMGSRCVDKTTLGVLTGQTKMTVQSQAAKKNLVADTDLGWWWWWNGVFADFKTPSKPEMEQMYLMPCANKSWNGWCSPQTGFQTGNN